MVVHDPEVEVLRHSAAAPPPPKKQRRKYEDAPIGDGKITWQDYKPTEGRAYPNWILLFSYNGKRYEKKRGDLPEHKMQHGEIEPLAYLHAIQTRILAGDDYFIENPRAHVPAEDVTAMVVAHRDVFLAIVAHFKP